MEFLRSTTVKEGEGRSSYQFEEEIKRDLWTAKAKPIIDKYFVL